jgi:hypothetical protein
MREAETHPSGTEALQHPGLFLHTRIGLAIKFSNGFDQKKIKKTVPTSVFPRVMERSDFLISNLQNSEGKSKAKVIRQNWPFFARKT